MMTDIFFVKNLFIPILKSYICPAYHKPSIINIPYKHLLILNKTLMNKTLRNLALVALVAAPVSAFADVKGTGTEKDPYLIETAEDLCNAHTMLGKDEATNVTYFLQTKDIDMTGVEDYIPVRGGDGATYSNAFIYDGQNHVITNFAPTKDRFDGVYCYGQTVFGVLTGTVKNLGVVNANVKTAKGCGGSADTTGQGIGILGGYFGHGNVSGIEAAKISKIENVYVEGTVTGDSKYTGAFFGTTSGSGIEITNCFANVTLTANGGKIGGMVGNIGCPATVTATYVAGTVSDNAYLIADGGKFMADGLVYFNTGSSKVSAAEIEGDVVPANTEATKADGIEEVKGWAAFSATETIDGYPALEYTLAGEGTLDSPYIIDGQRALCNAYRFVDSSKTGITYFKQTADVDMAGVELYHPIVGWNGSYAASIDYDGQNNVIKNFAPVEPEAVSTTDSNCPYYSNTIFGVLSGNLKNLAVIDADCTQKLQGIGILGAYVGHGDAKATPTNTIENVFVSGMVTCETGSTYAGGMFGTTATPTTVTNCFANVDLVIADATTIGGGLIGRVSNDSEFTCVYTAGTVSGEKAFLISNTKATPAIVADGVIAFNTGATEAFASAIKVEGDVEVADADNKADLIEDVKGWTAFSATKEIDGYPILKAFEAYGVEAGQSGIFDAAVEEGADAPAVYYNLQGVQVANPENGVYIVRRGSKVTKELIRK